MLGLKLSYISERDPWWDRVWFKYWNMLPFILWLLYSVLIIILIDVFGMFDKELLHPVKFCGTVSRVFIVPYLNAIFHCSNSLQWRHNGRGSASNHQPHDCLLNCLFRRRSKKTSKLRVTGLFGNSQGTGEFPAQMASYAENVSIWWRHHVTNEYFGYLMSSYWCICNDTSHRKVSVSDHLWEYRGHFAATHLFRIKFTGPTRK